MQPNLLIGRFLPETPLTPGAFQLPGFLFWVRGKLKPFSLIERRVWDEGAELRYQFASDRNSTRPPVTGWLNPSSLACSNSLGAAS